jgi:hypothetical protein
VAIFVPQFDTGAFFNQLFYLTGVFYTFYILLLHNYLPGLTRILKVRRKKLVLAFQEERPTTSNGYKAVLTGFGGRYRQTLTSSLQGGEIWVGDLLPVKEEIVIFYSHWEFLQLMGILRAQRVAVSTHLSTCKGLTSGFCVCGFNKDIKRI